jgi:putative membrane protein
MMNFAAWGNGMLPMILFWIVIIVLAILVLRTIFTSPAEHDGEKVKRSPAALTKERYARGEISRDEYQSILDELKEL